MSHTDTPTDHQQTSSVIIIQDNRWNNRLGVAAGERERLQNQLMKKNHDREMEEHKRKIKEEERREQTMKRKGINVAREPKPHKKTMMVKLTYL